MTSEQGKIRSGAMQEWIERLNSADEVFVDPPSGWQYGFPALWSRKEYPDVKDFLRAKGYPEEHIEFGTQMLRMWLPEQDKALDELTKQAQEQGEY